MQPSKKDATRQTCSRVIKAAVNGGGDSKRKLILTFTNNETKISYKEMDG